MKQICPWCDTEIVCDPEIGAEDECPHCFNELTDHRSMKIKLTASDDDDVEAEHYIEHQEKMVECIRCGEDMVEAGEQIVLKEFFKPKTVDGSLPPFIQAPFALRMFVCPSCFKIEYTL